MYQRWRVRWQTVLMAFDVAKAAAAQQEGKALAFHTAWADRSPTSTYAPGVRNPREDSVISQRNAGLHADAYGGRQAIDWVYDAIGLYVDPVATSPYRLEKPDGTKLVRVKTKGTPPDHDVGPEDFYRLLDKPNPFMLYDELMSLLVIDLLLVGNGYWFKYQTGSTGKPLAMYRLAPSHVKVVPGPYGPKRYEYQPPGARDKLKIKVEDIIHFKRPNPHDSYYGMGVIQGGGRAMDLELALTDTISSYYENKADPSLIIQSERRVPRDVFNKLRAQLRSRISGSDKAGELLVLEAGLKASSLSANARDALFNELANMSRNRILVKFRTSPLLFGLLDEASGSNKVSDARREFDNSTLKPFMAKLGAQITAALAEPWGIKYLIDHEQSLPPEEAIKVGESMAKLPGIKVREARRAYRQFGIEESTGDPEIDEMVLNLPGEEMDEDGQGGFADRPLGTEAGRPPKGENTKAINKAAVGKTNARVRAGKALSFEEIQRRIDAAVAMEEEAPPEEPDPAPEENDPEPKAVSTPAPDNRLPGEQRPDDTFARARQVDIDAAQNYIQSELRDAVVELERGLLDTVEGKALKTSDIVGRVKQSAAWRSFRERLETILEEGARRAAVSGVMHAGVTPDDEIDYDAIVKSVVHRPEGVRGIMKTIKDRVVRRVKEAREGDGERKDFESAIRTALTEYADRQVVAIADSEATEAYNEGALTVLELSGHTSVYVFDGDDHDKPCADANGQVWEIAHARQNRKQHPRCRRAFLALPQVA